MPPELKRLQSLAEHVKGYVEQGTKLNEANTKAAFVAPLIQWIGWDIRNPEEVRHEWRKSSRDEPVDYALCADDHLLLLIEAKPLHDPLKADKGWKQLAANGLNAGFRWCARMSGRLVILVNLLHEGALEHKVFWQVDLARLDEPGGMSLEEAADLLKLLSKEALVSGQTNDAWDEHQAQMNARAAIEALLEAPPQSLINLIREYADDPELSSTVIASSLAALVGKQPSKPPSKAISREVPEARAAKDTTSVEQHLVGKPHCQALFEGLLRRIKDTVGDFSLHANSRHIVLSNKYAFVVVKVLKKGLRMGLRLEISEADDCPRLKAQPKGIFEGWSALHVSASVSDASEIDEELLELIERAYVAAT